MRTVQVTIACTKGERERGGGREGERERERERETQREREREREREKLGTQVLKLPITERKSSNVNRNIYI